MRRQRGAAVGPITGLAAALAALAAAIMLAAGACGDSPAGLKFGADLGGATTRQDASRNSFSLPAPRLSSDEHLLFQIGDSFFKQNWVTAPASTEGRDGLGPTFNAQSCSSCHLLDGRGAPPDPTGAEARLGLLVRLSVPGADESTGAPLPVPAYGGQLQDRAVLGVPAEGRLAVGYTPVTGQYGDGTPFELRAPHYEIAEAAFGPLPDDVLTGPRLAPQLIGMGLLEAVPAEAVLARADPEDADEDGISGRANFVWSPHEGGRRLGRFGWKANTAVVEDQVTGAFHLDIGITSALRPAENCPEPQRACAAAPDGGRPELTQSRMEAVAAYIRTLSVPAMRDFEAPQVRRGAQLFGSFGCTSCHAAALETGPSDIAVLADQTIHPFTDLLLHDMGDGLADGRPDFGAGGSEWRTPPLWGLGLIDEVNGERFLLHDGRARTIEEAILWHGGEADGSREEFRLADEADREALLAFLEAL